MKARAKESPHRPTLSPEELETINRDTENFLGRFSRAHGAAIARNRKAVRYRLTQAITQYFPLKRGPEPDPRIVEVDQMLRQGVKRQEVYRRQVPGFDALDKYGRMLVAKSFEEKLRRYRCSLREDRKKPSENSGLKKHHNSDDKNPRETRG